MKRYNSEFKKSAVEIPIKFLVLLTFSLFLLTTPCCFSAVISLKEVFIPIMGPQSEINIRKVFFISYFSSPEFEISATCAAYKAQKFPEIEFPEANINAASLAGLHITHAPFGDKDTDKKVVIDVTEMKALPSVTKTQIIQLTITALELNLARFNIHNCRLIYEGREKHPDVDWEAFSSIINLRKSPPNMQKGDKKVTSESSIISAIERFEYNKNGRVIKERALAFEEDLDGSGKKEKILINPESQEGKFKILINGREMFSDKIEGMLYSACITDIQTSDNFKEIAVFSPGPSDDFITRYYRYKEGKIIFMGELSRALSPKGDGYIYTYEWMGSWTKYGKYEIDKESQLQEVRQPFYWVGISLETTNLLPLFGSQDKRYPPIERISPGEEITILMQNGRWLLVKSSRNTIGWAEYDDVYESCQDMPQAG